MELKIYRDAQTMSEAAAQHAARSLGTAIQERGWARIIAATGASQLAFLAALTAARDVDWSRVEMFHLDEYIGLSSDHPASFRKYLRDRLIAKTGIVRYHLIDGEDTLGEVEDEIRRAPIDVAFVGIGENGHLAFNDPPADFVTDRPYLVVGLDEACRRQQVGEGWFASVSEVPTHAITMSIRQILKSHEIICVVPDARKAEAVKRCLEGEVSPLAPASILQTHPHTTVYLDRDSAALLTA